MRNTRVIRGMKLTDSLSSPYHTWYVRISTVFPSGTLSAALDDWHVSANISTAKVPSIILRA
jgi:hypothetical protein